MKYITRILGIACLALSFHACSEDSFEVFQPQQSADDVSYSINFSLQLQEPVTRSVVYGEDGTDEKGVQTMQLLCFDASGLYLGIRTAELGDKGFYGKITGTVPQGTARIHFVANRQLNIPLDFPVGTPEEDVMQSLPTMYDFPAIIYWGYKKFNTAALMNAWLKGEDVTSGNIVYMIRDRAKIKLSLNSEKTKIIEGCTVTEVTWRIHNGHESGYIAPLPTEWTNYTRLNTGGHTPEDQAKIVSKATCNDNGSNRYTIINDDEEFEADNIPQYLFDDKNQKDEQMTQVVKVILKVKYTDKGTSKKKYFVTLVKAPDETYIPIIRNYTYLLTVSSLDLDLSYDTLEDAINGNKYANGDVEVSRNLTDINNNVNSLQIQLPTETTSIVFNMATKEGETNDLMQFVIIKTSDLSDAGVDPSNVKVYWEGGSSSGTTQGGIKNYVQLQTPTVKKNNSTGIFTIPVTITAPPEKLQNDWLVVEYADGENSVLRRYIHVYVINQFKFYDIKDEQGQTKSGLPTLKKSGNDYILSFRIPPLTAQSIDDPMYPEGLYPIDVKFTTSTLKAWSTNGTSQAYGSFGVSVESTSIYTDTGTGLSYDLFDEDGTAFESAAYTKVSNHTTPVNWWYQPNDNWDYWYTYSVKEYPTGDPNDPNDDGIVNIYFKDVTGSLNYTTTHSNVGLYLYIRYFGKIYAMTVPLPTN